MKIKFILPLASRLLSFVLLSLFTVNVPSVKAAEWKKIKDRGYIIVGVKDNLRPLGFRDRQGNLQGLEIDIAKQLAKELFGKEDAVKFVTVSNEDRIKALLNNKVDLIIARLTVTPSRMRIMDFTQPYYIDGTGLITKNQEIQKLSDLKVGKIAVLNGSDTIAVINNLLPEMELVGVDSYQQALNLLDNNQVVAFAADNSILTGWTQEYPQYHLLPVRLSGEPLAVVIPRGLQYNPLWDRVNNAIATWKKQGWLQQKLKDWGLP
jgi:polar amino acid transport system substrate-binding protein